VRKVSASTKTDYLKVVDSVCEILQIASVATDQNWRVGVKEQLEPAIAALQQQLTEQERKVIETKTLINRLCEAASMPPAYADVGAISGPSITAIRGDTFYGKVLTTAAREYLTMRKAANLGPTSVRDIYENLKKGGYPFETEDDNNAMTGIRQVLRKNSGIFHRLPNGEWGLTGWYERIKESRKQAKTSAVEDDDEEEKGMEEGFNEVSDKKDAA
jgi:hypothetical protein